MIQCKVITIKEDEQKIDLTMEGSSNELGAELAVIIASVLQNIEPIEGVTKEELAHGITDLALTAVTQEEGNVNECTG